MNDFYDSVEPYGDVINDEQEEPKFFDVVRRMEDLYVSYRAHYVVAVNGRTFIPYNGEKRKKLDRNAMIAHLSGIYAVGVYAGTKSSKFICFDVDMPDKEVVRKVINGLVDFGFEEDDIHVSFSGGKGFHVELFFSDLVYTNLLHGLYAWVISHEGLDPRKVEFRPTFGQAIKLPLGKHPKTGNICWFLDRKTLEPIHSFWPAMKIRRLDRDAVEAMINEKIPPFYEHKPVVKTPLPSLPMPEDSAGLPMMTGPGMRYNMMKQIGVCERYKKTPQDAIEAMLIDWAKRQNPSFITDPWKTVLKDASNIAEYVWSDRFAIRKQEVRISETDIQKLLQLRGRQKKRILFLVMVFNKRYGVARIPMERIAKYTGASYAAVFTTLTALSDQDVIKKTGGKKVRNQNRYASAPNGWIYVSKDGTYLVDWDFKAETFSECYLKTIRDNVAAKDYKKYFTPKEIEELKGGNTHGQV